MACCLMASSYLNQCWLIISEALWQFHRKCSRYLFMIWVWKLLIEDYIHISKGPMSKQWDWQSLTKVNKLPHCVNHRRHTYHFWLVPSGLRSLTESVSILIAVRSLGGLQSTGRHLTQVKGHLRGRVLLLVVLVQVAWQQQNKHWPSVMQRSVLEQG